jgi:GNAT superfamily N-acetyltransferase
MDYAAAHETVLVLRSHMASAELSGRPDLKPPEGPELEPERRGVYLVGYLNGEPVACGGYRIYPGDPSGETAELVRMYVRPGARAGVGRVLLAELEERARDDDYRYAILEIHAEQHGPQALYEVKGYRRVPSAREREGWLTYHRDLG